MSTDNRTIINDCEANTGWSGSDSASTNSLAGLFFEGSGSLSTQFSNTQENMRTTEDSVGTGTFSLDWSDSTLYMIIKDNLITTYALGGVQFVIGDATPDIIGYEIGGNDAKGVPLSLDFSTYRLDVSVIVAAPGTNFQTISGSEANLTQTACTAIGYGGEHTAKAQGAIDNVFMDCFRYISNGSYALTINGGTVGTPETMADVVTDDIASGWGMVSNPLGSQYLFAAPTEWGTPSGTADSYFTATDEQWFWVGDNGGGHALGATHFPFRAIGNGTGTNSIVWTRVSIVNTGTRAQLDLSNTDMNIVKLDTCTLSGLGAITMPVQSASNRFCDDTTFIDCDQIYLSTLDCDSCTFIGTTDAEGAVLWDASSEEGNQNNMSFVSDGAGHAVKINLNTASLTTYDADGYSASGYEATSGGSTGNTFFLVDNALDGDVTINLTNSTGDFAYEKAAGYTGTVTINTSVNVTFEAVDKTDAAIQSVRVTAYLIFNDTEVINTTTNASGIATTTFSGSTPADIYYRYRKSSTGATKYVNLSGFATIEAVTGTSVKRSMVVDDKADPTI